MWEGIRGERVTEQRMAVGVGKEGGGCIWRPRGQKSIKVTVFICLREVISGCRCKTLCSFWRFNRSRDHNPSRCSAGSRNAARIIIEPRIHLPLINGGRGRVWGEGGCGGRVPLIGTASGMLILEGGLCVCVCVCMRA